jgi:hypothetical protein
MIFHFLAQVDPVTVKSITNPFDYGIAIGTIIILFFVLYQLGSKVIHRFDEIATKHDDTIRKLHDEHKDERAIWREESQQRTQKIDSLCDRMIACLAKFGE